jgi:hypothetical protein
MGTILTLFYGALGGISFGLFHMYITLKQLEEANKVFYEKYNIKQD